MSLSEIFKDIKSKNSYRIGRGLGGKRGKTAGRGTKGQKSRSGANRKLPAWFEGGQTPMYRKTPKKRGFSHNVAAPITFTSDIINNHYKKGETVSPQTLLDKKLFRKSDLVRKIKIIKKSDLKEGIKFEDNIYLTKSLSKIN